MHFVIDRAKWRCGGDQFAQRGEGCTAMLNEQGYMCCLGQIFRKLGYADDALMRVASPSDVREAVEGYNPELAVNSPYPDAELFARRARDSEGCVYGAWYNSELSIEAMTINDMTCHPASREARLIELFKTHGHTIEFINEYHVP